MSFRTLVPAFPVPSGPFAGIAGAFERSTRTAVRAG
ncbi:hypothetical protein BDSB_11310 [Burkholderia dolosa PC543]|nr:hypothetical protein BDSB_11310 [Burkholderia dolosa PC543]